VPRLLLRSVALLAVLSVAGPTVASAIEIEPAVTLVDLVPGQERLVQRAAGLFAEAGLDLPPVEIVHHPTDDGCFGRRGAHTTDGRRSTIHLCVDESGRDVEYLFLHELAHAWERKGVSDEQRSEFLRLRGLTEWRNDDPERWHERGAEHAAEIMVWGLMDRPISIATLEHDSCAELRAAYEVLTGQAPLHGYTTNC